MFAHYVWLSKFLVSVCWSSVKFSYMFKLPPSCKVGECCRLDSRCMHILRSSSVPIPRYNFPTFFIFWLSWYMGRF